MTMTYAEGLPSDETDEKIMSDFFSNDDNSSIGSINSKRRLKPPLGKRDSTFLPLSSEKITDKHYASDMIRRTTFANAGKRNEDYQLKQRSFVSNDTIDDDESLRSLNSIERKTSNKQHKGLHSQSMMTIIQQVMEVHNTVTGT